MKKFLLILFCLFFVHFKAFCSKCPNPQLEMKFVLPSENLFYSKYVHQFLKSSLENIGCKFHIKDGGLLPRPRAWDELKTGNINIYWGIATKEREKNFIFIRNDIMNKLYSGQLLMIPKGRQKDYDNVKTLDDFRKLNKTAVVNPVWAQYEYLKASGLPVIPQNGSIFNLVRMLASADRGIDYLPVPAVTYTDGSDYKEVEEDMKKIEYEKNLLLVFEGGELNFVMNKSISNYKENLEYAVQNFEKSGEKEKLINSFFSKILKKINLNSRKEIYFENPAKD